MLNKVILCLVSFSLLGILLSISPVSSAQEEYKPLVATYGSKQASFDEVIAGAVGTAHLVYYLPNKGLERPSIVVRLSRESADGDAFAEVFETPVTRSHIPLEFRNGFPILPADLQPVLTFRALDGWWERDGIVNYNLDIIVYGSVKSMWATGGDRSWQGLLERNEPNARIIVRDTDADGLPDWDWRTMLPEFPSRSDYRTTYAERKCESPLGIDHGLLPTWPFVAEDLGYSYEQDIGTFRPPIIVDWEAGTIKTFSEIVTLRNQNCSYGMHSIERVVPGVLNSPNFETPFAFYDLSGEGVGYPNLLLRTQRDRENDAALYLDQNPETLSVRYSWRNRVGDGQWDYKIDVIGHHPYDNVTPIAGGMALIDAPAYEDFPEWVVNREWPATSFVAVEDEYFKSNEGIYEWSMRNLFRDYYYGWDSEPYLTPFEDIRPGFRGEYRLEENRSPALYFSPIDNRLHLKWAEAGLQRLNSDQVVRFQNLDGDATIDVWSREVFPIQEEDAEVQPDHIAPAAVETLYALDGYLLHSKNETVTVLETAYNPALFETLPPVDSPTWRRHRDQMAAFEEERRDASDLRKWLDAFPGREGAVSGATLTNLRITDQGFRFELNLHQDFEIVEEDFLGLSGLDPGSYLVTYSEASFDITEQAPADLNFAIKHLDDFWAVTESEVTIENHGQSDLFDQEFIMAIIEEDGSLVEIGRVKFDALAQDTTSIILPQIQDINEWQSVEIWIENSSGDRVEGPIGITKGEPRKTWPVGTSIRIISVFQVAAIILVLLGLVIIVVWSLRILFAETT